MERFTGLGFKLALEMLLSLAVGMTAREYVRAWAASRLGDPTPRLWGRISLRPKPWFDAIGSGVIPALVAILWAAQIPWVPAAYAKPAPVDPAYLRRQPRDTILVSLAGPAVNLVSVLLAGLVLRIGILPGEAQVFAVMFAFTNSSLFVFHLLPIPGLDGARMVALALAPSVRETYRHFDQYLPLVVIAVLILFSGSAFGILGGLARAVCRAATGSTCL